MTPCPCSQPMPARGDHKAARRVTIDRAALRHELGDVPEIREAMTAKGAGRPSANVNVLWQLLTKSVYRSGDLPWLATRESLQNGWDAIRAAIRARQIKADDARFAVSWDGVARTLVFDDNGIGMDVETILGKFRRSARAGSVTRWTRAKRQAASASPRP